MTPPTNDRQPAAVQNRPPIANRYNPTQARTANGAQAEPLTAGYLVHQPARWPLFQLAGFISKKRAPAVRLLEGNDRRHPPTHGSADPATKGHPRFSAFVARAP